MNFTIDPLLANQQKGFGDVTPLFFSFFNSSSRPITNSFGQFTFYGTTVPTSASIGASEYISHVFQASVAGGVPGTSGSFNVQSTVDGVNLVTEFSISNMSNSQSIVRLTNGRRQYFLASFSGSGNATGSLYLLSGQT
jgi:hypothetical protein